MPGYWALASLPVGPGMCCTIKIWTVERIEDLTGVRTIYTFIATRYLNMGSSGTLPNPPQRSLECATFAAVA